MIAYWHDSVVCLSVYPPSVCDTVYCG